jgi:Putative Flp pilus-assembly TadE/G-like
MALNNRERRGGRAYSVLIPAEVKKEMTTSNPTTSRISAKGQAGQTTVLLCLVLGIFLLGLAGLAVDVSNWWFHKQMAQGAADAACTAGVMDLLSNASAGSSIGGFPTGSPPAAFTCASGSTTAACQYAALNGYGGGGLLAGQGSNDVQISFPGSVPGVATCSSTVPPPCVPAAATVANPFILVNVVDRVPTTFTRMISNNSTSDVTSSAVCGVLTSTAPVPIIVMNPTCQHAFEVSGSATVSIVGGPNRSIQVNSSNANCAAAGNGSANQCNGNPTVDLSKGGPNFTGSEFAVVGVPKTPSVTFQPGTTGAWSTGGPISDPYALVPAPNFGALSVSPTNGAPLSVAYGVDGCPDHTANCDEYKPGIYTTKIVVQNKVAIFVPGIYYMKVTTPDTDNGGSPGAGCLASNGPFNNSRYALAAKSNSILRPASNSAPGSDGSNGVMFYLSGTAAGNYASVFVDSSSGSSPHNVDPYVTANATCPGGTAPPAQLNLPASVPGNVIAGPCTSKGTYLGGGSTDTSGTIRGLIFFQDRANADNRGQPSMQGGGGLVLAGNMYFHNCNSSGTGTNCSAPQTGYQAFFQLQGNPSGGTYVLGNITTDELVLGGNGAIAMSLNPNAVYNILKASLLE